MYHKIYLDLLHQLVFILLLLSLCNSAHAQSPSSGLLSQEVGNHLEQQSQALLRKSVVVPPSAEASSLGKYGEYEVNTYTGVPNIQIPIFSHNDTRIATSLALNYSASGIKVADAPTIVGAGWNLSGIPMVSRSVVGLMDNASNYFGFQTQLEDAAYTPTVKDFAEIELLYDLANGTLESQTDVFHFTLLNKSGKFYITPNKQIIQKEYADIKITAHFGVNDEINAFTILDEYGLKYYFDITEKTTTQYDDGNTDPAEDNRLSPVNTQDVEYNSSWYVRTIQVPSGNEKVTYSYSNQPLAKALPLNVDLYTTRTYQQCNSDGGSNPSPVNHPGLLSATFLKNKKTIQSIQHQVAGELYQLDFNTSLVTATESQYFYANDLKLDNIQLKRNNSFIKEWDFNYAQGQSRLILESIQEKSGALNIPPHTFEYYSGNLPAFDANSLDHWGYYNNGLELLPTYNYTSNELNDANREPDANKTKYATLQKIYYPTGGHVEFELESNQIVEPVSTNQYMPMDGQPSYESCDDMFNTCCVTNGEESESMNTIYISQYMIDNGWWRIKADPIDCEAGDPATVNDLASYIIQIFPLDANSQAPIPIGQHFNNEMNVSGIFIEDVQFDFNVDTPGYYNLRIVGYETRVELEWYHYQTITNPVTREIGGLRVKSINVFDGNQTQILETQYDYFDGLLFAEPNYIKVGSYKKYPVPMIGTDPNVPEDHCSTITIMANSNQELSSVQGSPIGYGRVEKKVIEDFASNTGNVGKTVYHYHNQTFSTSVNDPVKNGKLKKIELYNRHNNLVSKTEYGYSFEDNSHLNPQNNYYGYAVVPSSEQDNKIYYEYDPVNDVYEWKVLENGGAQTVKTKLERKSNGFRLMEEYKVYPTYEEKTEYFFGNDAGTVVSRKEYTYGSSNHLQPTEVKTIVGNGQEYIDKMYYPDDHLSSLDSDVTDNNVKDYWLNKNVILPAWKTEKYISNTASNNILDGTKNIYNLSSGVAVPSQNLRFELPSSGTGSWENQYEIQDFDIVHYKPKKIKYQGWPYAHQYTYSPTSKLSMIDYLSTADQWTWSYVYHPTNDQLQSSTDPNGISTTYQFDPLLRLEKTTSRAGTVGALVTDYSYQYGASNQITLTQHYDFGTTHTVQQFDGIGRLVSTVHPDNSVSTISYDNAGRVHIESDPISGTYTNTYLPDPLNRPLSKLHSSGLGNMTYSYGAGSTPLSNVPNVYIQSTTDADGKISKSYTDILGRNLVSSQGTAANLVHTVSKYDTKSRVTDIYPPDGYNNAALGYHYTYDGDDNRLSAKLPDKALVEYKYDQRNFLTAESNELVELGFTNGLLPSSVWVNTEYDDYGRVSKVGFGSTPNAISSPIIEHTYADPNYKMAMSSQKVFLLQDKFVSTQKIITDYVYDNAVRVQSSTEHNDLLGVESIVNTYDNADNILSINKTTDGVVSLTNYMFDAIGRLDISSLTYGGVSLSFDNDYYTRDQLKQKILGAGLQTVDYSYLSNGWLSKINTSTTGSYALPLCPSSPLQPINSTGVDDLFSLDIRYDQPSTGTAQHNGNISELHWQVKGRAPQHYAYTYDHLNRLSQANHSSSNAYNSAYTYDNRGNILTLSRQGLVTGASNCYTATMIDDMTYTYASNSNQFTGITDAVDVSFDNCPDHVLINNAVTATGQYGAEISLKSDAMQPSDLELDFRAEQYAELLPGFEMQANENGYLVAQVAPCPTGNNMAVTQRKDEYGFIEDNPSNLPYLYDVYGNLTQDPNKKIKIKYNYLNLPYEVTDLQDQVLIEWDWSADGRKLRKRSHLSTGLNTQEYYGNVEYNNGQLEAIYFDDGRISQSSNGDKHAEYYLKDHLGNTRIVFSDTNGDGQISLSDDANNEVLQESHYYPFGMRMSGPSYSQSSFSNNYLYNGKELNTEFGLNWQNYGARFYDNQIGRFTGVDPISADFAHVSTYNYAENEPANSIDLHGLQRIPVYLVGEVDKIRKKVNRNLGTNIPLIGNDPVPPLVFKSLGDLGQEAKNIGDKLETVGLVVAMAFPPAGGAIASTGGVIDGLGTVVVTIDEINNDGELSNSNTIDILVDGAAGILPKPFEEAIDGLNLDKAAADVFKAHRDALSKVAVDGIKEGLEKTITDDKNCDSSCEGQ